MTRPARSTSTPTASKTRTTSPTRFTDYNNTVSKKDKITYTDYVGLMMSSVTTIVNVISYVLIAFVSVSLIVYLES